MRSIWKGFFLNFNYLKRNNFKHSQTDVKKMIYHRSSIISRFMNKTTVLIYTGCYFKQIKITKKMHSLKFGEMALTRKPFVVKEKTYKMIKFHTKKVRNK